ncbi:MAG: minor capsid protein [Lachnospiraceae bacterium]|nr:minor capsid protein [Lachnospiraceae bacterium]
MRNSTYWKKQFALLEQMQNQKGLQCYAQIDKQYRTVQKQMEGQIRSWYQRFSESNGMSLQESRRMLTNREQKELKYDLNEYICYGKEHAVNNAWLKQLKHASIKSHTSRLDFLELQMQQSMEAMFANQYHTVDSAMQEIYQSGYYHIAFELQKGIGVGWKIAALDEGKIAKVMQKPWAADGKNFSERIWSNRQKLVNELHSQVSRSIILGQDPQQVIDIITKKLDTSKKIAERLVMTEEAFFSGAAQKDCFEELGVEQYEIVATLDSHTSKICHEMDGKVFPMSQWEVGVTAPPFHVWCRTTTVPAFGDQFDRMEKRAVRDEDGETYHIPEDISYEEWQRAFVDGDTSGLQKTNLNEEHAIIDFTQSRKQYDEHVQKLAELEKQSEEIFHAYMEAMDASEAIDLQQALNEKYDEIESVREIVKDMKAGLSGKEAKAVRKLEKDLAIKAGIPIDKVKMTGLPYDTAHIIYNSYKTVLNKYPELKGNLEGFEYNEVLIGQYARCKLFTGKIQVCRIFENCDNLAKSYARDVANGFHPVGTDHRGIIVHELGHALDGYMTNQGLLGGKRKSDGKIETTSETVKDMTLKLLGFSRQEIEMELKKRGLTYIQRCDILEQRERDFITEHVSKYAAKNEKEFFAECFAEYMTSENPREAATIFGAIIERALGR